MNLGVFVTRTDGLTPQRMEYPVSDAPIFTFEHISDLDAASDFEKKHTPYIEVEAADGGFKISVAVGHYVPHPNDPDHFIQWIELHIDGTPVAFFHLSPVATAPRVSVVVNADAGATVRAIEHCNLHGRWAAEATL